MSPAADARGAGRRRVLPRRAHWVCVALLVLQTALLATLAADRSPRPLGVPITIVAPPAVADALASGANELEGDPFRATAADDAEAATRDVREGVVVAAVLVDLSGTTDTLVLNDARDPRLNRAVQEQVLEMETAHGRTVEVSRVAASRVSTGYVRSLALAASLAGFLVVVAISVLVGPAARTTRLGLARLASLVVVFAGLSYVAAWVTGDLDEGSRAELGAVLAVSMLVAAIATLALESVFGLGGLGVSVTLFVVLSTPLLLRIDPHLLPPPWPALSGHTPSGASVEAISAVALFGGAGLRAPLIEIAAWLAAGLVTLVVARWQRNRAGTVSDHGPHLGLWRLRVAIFVAPTFALSMVIASLVPRDAVASSVDVASVASETECVATGPIDSLADVNRVATRLRGGPEFQGGDVGADVVLQDGRHLIVFGDTLRRADFDGQRFVRNSLLVMDPGCIQVVLPADRGALIPDRPGGSGSEPVGYWPMAMSRIGRPGYDLVLVSTQRVRTTGAALFDFEILGPSAAVFVAAKGDTPQLVAVQDIGPDSTDPTRPIWGAALASDGGWLYVYGTAKPTGAVTFGHSLQVARVRPDDYLEPSAWHYWDGARWSRDPESATELIAAEGGTSQTLSVFERDGTWFALSKRDDFLGTDIVVWSAPAPWGPFDDGQPVAKLPSNAATGQLRYMPLAHPDLFPEPGSIVISYSRNRTDTQQVVDNPLLYRPRYLRVPLPAR